MVIFTTLNSISTGYLAGIHSFDDPMVLFSATISEAGALASSFCVFPFVYVSTPKYVFETFGGLFMAVTGFSIALNLVIVFIYNLYRVLKRRKEEEPEEEVEEGPPEDEEEEGALTSMLMRCWGEARVSGMASSSGIVSSSSWSLERL